MNKLLHIGVPRGLLNPSQDPRSTMNCIL